MEKQKDVRLNKDFRNAYIKDFRSFLERQTNNPKYQSFLESRENCKGKIDNAFKTAQAVLERRFNPTDVSDLKRLQTKYTTVDSVGKDSCFYMAVVDDKGKSVKEKLDSDRDEVAKQKHFDFNLKGSLNGSEYDRQKDFAYAWYREEMKANGLNPDCDIEHSGNQSNPALSTHQNNNSSWLKGNDGSSSNYVNKWENDYALDIIGTGGCRSRAIPCSDLEFAKFEMMHQAKQDVVLKHTKWLQVILAKVKVFEAGVKLMTKFSQVEKYASHPKINWTINPEILVDKFGTDVVISIDNLADQTYNIGQPQQTRKEKMQARILYDNSKVSSIAS